MTTASHSTLPQATSFQVQTTQTFGQTPNYPTPIITSYLLNYFSNSQFANSSSNSTSFLPSDRPSANPLGSTPRPSAPQPHYLTQGNQLINTSSFHWARLPHYTILFFATTLRHNRHHIIFAPSEQHKSNGL